MKSSAVLTFFITLFSLLSSAAGSPVLVYQIEHDTIYVLDGQKVSTALDYAQVVVTPTPAIPLTTSTPVPTTSTPPPAPPSTSSSSYTPAVKVYVETVVSTQAIALPTTTSTPPPAPATTSTTISPASTTAASPSPSLGGGSTGNSYADAILGAHNGDRASHSAPALVWNETLADYAQNYLSNQNCVFAHSGGPYGENLAWGYPSAADGVAAWYSEGRAYNYEAAQFSDSTGHFTQVVWIGSTQVGCATVDCSGSQFLACEYYPRGNIIGEFSKNVLPN